LRVRAADFGVEFFPPRLSFSTGPPRFSGPSEYLYQGFPLVNLSLFHLFVARFTGFFSPHFSPPYILKAFLFFPRDRFIPPPPRGVSRHPLPRLKVKLPCPACFREILCSVTPALRRPIFFFAPIVERLNVAGRPAFFSPSGVLRDFYSSIVFFPDLHLRRFHFTRWSSATPPN